MRDGVAPRMASGGARGKRRRGVSKAQVLSLILPEADYVLRAVTVSAACVRGYTRRDHCRPPRPGNDAIQIVEEGLRNGGRGLKWQSFVDAIRTSFGEEADDIVARALSLRLVGALP